MLNPKPQTPNPKAHLKPKAGEHPGDGLSGHPSLAPRRKGAEAVLSAICAHSGTCQTSHARYIQPFIRTYVHTDIHTYMHQKSLKAEYICPTEPEGLSCFCSSSPRSSSPATSFSGPSCETSRRSAEQLAFSIWCLLPWAQKIP